MQHWNIKQIIPVAAVGAALTFIASARAADIGFQAETGSGPGLGGGLQGNPFLVNDTLALGGSAVDFVGPSLTAKPIGVTGRLLTYELSFPSPGDYALYVRARVSSDALGFGADSFFIAQTFGASPSDFWRVNNLYNLGAPAAADYRWYNLLTESDVAGAGFIAVDNNANNTGPNNNLLYTVAAAGPQTFAIGGREVGLYLDAFVFSDNLALTSAQLDAAVVPEPGVSALLLLGLVLLFRRKISCQS